MLSYLYLNFYLTCSCKIQITRFLASALTDEDFGGVQSQMEFVRTLGVEASQGGGGGASFLVALLKDLAEELSTLEMFDEVGEEWLSEEKGGGWVIGHSVAKTQ